MLSKKYIIDSTWYIFIVTQSLFKSIEKQILTLDWCREVTDEEYNEITDALFYYKLENEKSVRAKLTNVLVRARNRIERFFRKKH